MTDKPVGLHTCQWDHFTASDSPVRINRCYHCGLIRVSERDGEPFKDYFRYPTFTPV